MEYCLIPPCWVCWCRIAMKKNRMTVSLWRGRRKDRLSNTAGWQTRDQPSFPLKWVWHGSVSRQIDTQRQTGTEADFHTAWGTKISCLLMTCGFYSPFYNRLTPVFCCFPWFSHTGKIWRGKLDTLSRSTILMRLLTLSRSVESDSVLIFGLSPATGLFVHGIFQSRILSGLQFPPPEDLFNPGLQPTSFVSPALQGDSLLANPSGKPILMRDPGLWLFPCAF